MRSRMAAASSPDSVRCPDWNASASAIDFLPAASCSRTCSLAAWITLSNNLDHLDGIQQAVKNLVQAIEEKFAQDENIHPRAVTSAVLMLAFMAFGDALLGQQLSDMLDRERAAPRKIATLLLPTFFAPQ